MRLELGNENMFPERMTCCLVDVMQYNTIYKLIMRNILYISNFRCRTLYKIVVNLVFNKRRITMPLKVIFMAKTVWVPLII